MFLVILKCNITIEIMKSEIVLYRVSSDFSLQ